MLSSAWRFTFCLLLCLTWALSGLDGSSIIHAAPPSNVPLPGSSKPTLPAAVSPSAPNTKVSAKPAAASVAVSKAAQPSAQKPAQITSQKSVQKAVPPAASKAATPVEEKPALMPVIELELDLTDTPRQLPNDKKLHTPTIAPTKPTVPTDKTPAASSAPPSATPKPVAPAAAQKPSLKQPVKQTAPNKPTTPPAAPVKLGAPVTPPAQAKPPQEPTLGLPVTPSTGQPTPSVVDPNDPEADFDEAHTSEEEFKTPGEDSVVKETPTIDAAQCVHIPNTGLCLSPPTGFFLSKKFNGFVHPSLEASIQAGELSIPFTQIKRAFQPTAMRNKGLMLLERTNLLLHNYPAMLVHYAQVKEDQRYLKWSLIIGDAQSIALLTGTLPENRPKAEREMLKKVMLSTQWQRGQSWATGDNKTTDPTKPTSLEKASAMEALGWFAIEVPPKYKLADRFLNTLVYSLSGELLTKPVKEDPMFMVGRSDLTLPADQHRSFAMERLKLFAPAYGHTIQAVEPITIDGLQGFAIDASGIEQASGEPVTLYQVMLFDPKAYYAFIAMIGGPSETKKAIVSELKQMALTFKRFQYTAAE